MHVASFPRPLVIAALVLVLVVNAIEGRFPGAGSAAAHHQATGTLHSRGRVITGAQTSANGQGFVTFRVPKAFTEGG